MIDKERLAKEYVWVHENTTTMSGRTTVNNKDRIKEVIDRVNPVNVLDFGCGKGWQYTRQNMHEYWGIEKPVLYDPYVAKYNKLAGYRNRYFDLVLCVDVMEHILPNEVDNILHSLFFLGNYVYFHIDTKPAIKTFSCGTNFHISLHDEDWWINKLNEYGTNWHADFD
tara:strand:+ start:333 stop:836 length:504 start_codon:yes stop_codon:yes gene_type:complete